MIIDVHKPLVDGFFIPRVDRDRIWAAFKYEGVQDFCFSCGRLGHTLKSCEVDVVLSRSGKFRFGKHMQVSLIRYSMSIRRSGEDPMSVQYGEEV